MSKYAEMFRFFKIGKRPTTSSNSLFHFWREKLHIVKMSEDFFRTNKNPRRNCYKRLNIITYSATVCCGGEECFTLLLSVHQDEPDEAVNRGSICSRISLQHLYKVLGHHHALTKYLAETEK